MTFSTRNWRVVDQALPVPFQLGSSTLNQASFIPSVDSLGGTMAAIRQFASFRAYHDAGGFDPVAGQHRSRLIGRSVWNTDWVLIIRWHATIQRQRGIGRIHQLGERYQTLLPNVFLCRRMMSPLPTRTYPAL